MTTSTPNDDAAPKDSDLEQVAVALKGLRFGQVTVTVQDGVVVQIDRTERRRINRLAN